MTKRVLIAGAGVAAVEAVLAVRNVAGGDFAAYLATARPRELAEGCSSTPAPPRGARITWTDDRVGQRAEG